MTHPRNFLDYITGIVVDPWDDRAILTTVTHQPPEEVTLSVTRANDRPGKTEPGVYPAHQFNDDARYAAIIETTKGGIRRKYCDTAKERRKRNTDLERAAMQRKLKVVRIPRPLSYVKDYVVPWEWNEEEKANLAEWRKDEPKAEHAKGEGYKARAYNPNSGGSLHR